MAPYHSFATRTVNSLVTRMNEDPLVLANRLVELGEARAAVGVLQTALLSFPQREDIRRRFDELALHVPSGEAPLLPEGGCPPKTTRLRLAGPFSRKDLLLALAGAAALVCTIAWALGPGAGLLVAGMALCLAVARAWLLRLPLRWKGNEIRHAARPFSYHACTLALFLFSVMLLVAGLGAVFRS